MLFPLARRAIVSLAFTSVFFGAAAPARAQLKPSLATLKVHLHGVPSPASENPRGEPDAAPPPMPRGYQFAPIRLNATTRRFAQNPNASAILAKVVQAMTSVDINVALVAGHKYMINSCLGIKASAGTFRLHIPTPDLRLDGNEVVLTFRVDHVGMSALTIRLRPDVTDLVEPCHFSGRIGIGGYVEDIRYELRFNPLLTPDGCSMVTMSNLHDNWSIGKVHLDPLPTAVTPVSGDLLDDAFNIGPGPYVVQRITDLLISALNAQCHE
ncbi:MAG TPA: hypothetical protein VF021_12245 [Longimicrobiales bacterium]